MSPRSGGSSSGLGITRSIREHLNFTDDKKWKEFSNRRLELIDKYNLSSKKASDQDNDLKEIADLLRKEFGFPVHTLNDFDKLVRAAVQSVRRNRKRSSRARVNNDRFIKVEETPKSNSSSLTTSTINSPLSNTLFPPIVPNNNYHTTTPLTTTTTTSTTTSATTTSTTKSNSSTSSTSNSLATSPQNIRPSIKPLTSGIIPPISTGSSSLTDPSQSSFRLTSSSKQKLLNYIQKSKTCLMLSNNDPSIHGDNLLNLGKSIISSSISFVLERFFSDISTDSINYLFEKLNTNTKNSQILKSLGYLSSDIMILSDLQASNLLCKLIGCCVKDFGFDSIGYTIGEIFHEVILNEYPLISTQVTKITQESLVSPLLPIVPQEADSEVTKDVQLRFGSRVLDFKYTPLSSAPPTYLELVENGKTGFGIDKSKNIRLRYDGKELLDIEISKIFKDLNLKKIEIELYEVEGRINSVGFTRLL